MTDAINSVIFHPYILAIYGVLLWQIEQWFTSRKTFKDFIFSANRNIGRSLIWVGVIVVFDDELLAKYNEWAAMDYHEMPLYMYTISGFFIDLIRSKLTQFNS